MGTFRLIFYIIRPSEFRNSRGELEPLSLSVRRPMPTFMEILVFMQKKTVTMFSAKRWKD